MCLGIPGKVVEVFREHDLLTGRVDFGGVFKRVCLEYVPEVTNHPNHDVAQTRRGGIRISKASSERTCATEVTAYKCLIYDGGPRARLGQSGSSWCA